MINNVADKYNSEYASAVFSDNLQEAQSITEPVFVLKRHGCTIFEETIRLDTLFEC